VPRFARWCLFVALVLPVSAPAEGLRRTTDDTPNAETLKRLAQQLQGDQMPKDIDPELLKLAQQYLEKNPDILKDPKFQEQLKQMQQQAKTDPKGFTQQLKERNPNLTPDQMETIRRQFQQPNPNGGFQPPPNIGQPPDNVGQPPRPNVEGPAPVQQPQWQPPQGGPTPMPPVVQDFPPVGPNGRLPSYAEQAQSKEGYQQAVAFWENNFGSIEQTPELKKSLIDMFSGEGNGPGGGGNNPWNGSGGKNTPGKPWWDNGTGGANDPNQSGFMKWLKNSTSNGPPNWLKNMTEWNKSGPPPNMSAGNFNPPQAGSFGGRGGGFGDVSSGAWPVAIVVTLLVLLVAGFVAWRYWPQIQAKLLNKPKAVAGLGPWTIDPRDVKDRETLVKAFDYLSVLICGDGARVWNHMTIADAFRQNVPGARPFAEPLARLYALARYSPANEPMDPADIAEARGHLCRLAEVQA
jgi:hypothetical protein